MSDEDQPQPVKRTGSLPVPEGYRYLRNRRPPTLQREQESGLGEQSAPAHHRLVYSYVQPSPYYSSAPGGREYGAALPPPLPSAPVYGYYPIPNPSLGWPREPGEYYSSADTRPPPPPPPPPPLRRASREYLHESRREAQRRPSQDQQRRSATAVPRSPFAAAPPPVVREHTRSAPDEEDLYSEPLAYEERPARARSASLLSGGDDDYERYSEVQFPHHRPSRRLRHSRFYDGPGGGVADSDSDAFDDYEGFLGTTKAFEFTPSRSSSRSRVLSDDSAVGSDREQSPARPAPPGQVIDGVISDHQKAGAGILNVYESRYTGDALSDGAHAVKLTVMHDSKSTRHRQALFRWLHVRQNMMDFQELSNAVTAIPDLPDGDRTVLVKLLTEVKRNYIKTKQTNKGSNVRFMEPRYFQLPLPSEDSAKGQSSRRRTITWICIPYFSLEKYAGLGSATMASQYPNQALLQAQYSRINRERDMQQAVCQLGGSLAPGSCFHISQLWCIVIDNSFLITCGSMTEATLRGELITIVNEPTRNGRGPNNGLARILVAYGEAVLWAIPVHECETWFSFLTYFHDFWPQALRFCHHDRPICEDDWPRIINLAKRSNSTVTLSLKTVDPPQPPVRGVLGGKGPDAIPSLSAENSAVSASAAEGLKPPKGTSTDKAKPEQDKNDKKAEVDLHQSFHVFTWMETVLVSTGTAQPWVDKEALEKQLKEVDDYLCRGTSFTDKKAYTDCEENTRESLFQYLEQQGAEMERLRNASSKKRGYEERIDIFNAADMVFQFFFPLDIEAPTVKRYWGAVSALIQLSSADMKAAAGIRRRRQSDAAPLNAPMVRKVLRQLTQPIQSFKTVLAHAHHRDRARVVVPNQFVQAWLHLLMGLIHSSADGYVWRDHFEFAEGLIRSAMREVVDGLSSVDLLDRAVIGPMELVSTIGLSLFRDFTGNHMDISETYSEYLQSLESDITTKPSDRYTQHRINLLKQELLIIKRTIVMQIAISGILFPGTSRSGDSWETWAKVSRQRGYHDETTRRLAHNHQPVSRVRHPGPGPASPEGYAMRSHRNHATNYYQSAPARRGERENMYAYGYQDEASDGETWTGDYGAAAADVAQGNVNEYWRLSPTWRGGFRGLLSLDCFQILQRKAQELDEFQIHAESLEEDNLNKVELNKDRQEMAIYVFTLVTVVFLPLSAVASVFGINTADIRDTELTQVSPRPFLTGKGRPWRMKGGWSGRSKQKQRADRVAKVGLLGRRDTRHGGRHRAGAVVDGRAGQHVRLARLQRESVRGVRVVGAIEQGRVVRRRRRSSSSRPGLVVAVGARRAPPGPGHLSQPAPTENRRGQRPEPQESGAEGGLPLITGIHRAGPIARCLPAHPTDRPPSHYRWTIYLQHARVVLPPFRPPAAWAHYRPS
ncbi:hypothetical protein RB601_005236 [Gaeumannomyces tritici]